jgi:tRNA (guanine37-N1)-methyltransferase
LTIIYVDVFTTSGVGLMERVRAFGLRVARPFGEEFRKVLVKNGLLSKELKPFEYNGLIHFPLSKRPSEEEMNILRGFSFEEGIWDFPLKPKARPRSLSEALLGKLPPHILAKIPKSFDVVGDVALLETDEDIATYGHIIGEGLRSMNSKIRLVLLKVSPISGEYRVAKYLPIWGEGKTETVHKENGCLLSLDITKVFFTPRLSCERLRVAKLVKDQETVADLFAGVGPFSVLIAKSVRDVVVHAVELNESAYNYLVRNISLNRVFGKVVPHLGDARYVASTVIKGKCDRVIMNLPFGSELFLDAGSDALKAAGGVIHLYSTLKSSDVKEGAFLKVSNSLKRLGWGDVEQEGFRVVREVGPRVYNVVFDIRVSNRSRGP